MDTAQALPAETNRDAQIANAAEAFMAFDGPPRDSVGRFAKPVEDIAEPEDIEAHAEIEAEGEVTEQEEAAEEAQPMPASWPADQAEQWEQLPVETQSYLAEREAERDRAVNAKFQDAANTRKAAEALQAEAQTNRQHYAETLEALEAVLQPKRPDPREYGAGTGQYNREAYDLALLQYEQQADSLNSVKAELRTIREQQEQEERSRYEAWRSEVEKEWAPKFVAEVPDLTDAVKAGPLLQGLVEYAQANGIPEDVFTGNGQNITTAELRLLWKAKEFDRLSQAETAPKPRAKAGPVVRPGVSSPRSAQTAARHSKNLDRLAREGTIEAGAAVWKNFL